MDSVAGLKIPEEVKEKIRKAVEVVKSAVPDAEILLFGSFARGDWLEESDIDLMVVSDRFEGLDYISRIYLVKRRLWERGLTRVSQKLFEKNKVRRGLSPKSPSPSLEALPKTIPQASGCLPPQCHQPLRGLTEGGLPFPLRVAGPGTRSLGRGLLSMLLCSFSTAT